MPFFPNPSFDDLLNDDTIKSIAMTTTANNSSTTATTASVSPNQRWIKQPQRARRCLYPIEPASPFIDANDTNRVQLDSGDSLNVRPRVYPFVQIVRADGNRMLINNDNTPSTRKQWLNSIKLVTDESNLKPILGVSRQHPIISLDEWKQSVVNNIILPRNIRYQERFKDSQKEWTAYAFSEKVDTLLQADSKINLPTIPPTEFEYNIEHEFYMSGESDTKEHFKYMYDWLGQINISASRDLRVDRTEENAKKNNDGIIRNDGFPPPSKYNINFATYVYETWDGKLFYSFDMVERHLEEVGVPRVQHAPFSDPDAIHTDTAYLQFGYSVWEFVEITEIITRNDYPKDTAVIVSSTHIMHRYPIVGCGVSMVFRIPIMATVDPDTRTIDATREDIDEAMRTSLTIISPRDIKPSSSETEVANVLLASEQSKFLADEIGTVFYCGIEQYELAPSILTVI